MKRKTAWYGLLIAVAFVLSYLESMLPTFVPVPGVKLGLANSVVLLILYTMRPTDALVVSVARILLAGFTFGSPASMLYSFCGGLLSIGVMMLCRRIGRFGVVGVSIAGGVSHNIGQLMAAAVVMHTVQIVWYLPVLLLSGLLTGGLIGYLTARLLPHLRHLPLGPGHS